jgi:hypothetical protein
MIIVAKIIKAFFYVAVGVKQILVELLLPIVAAAFSPLAQVLLAVLGYAVELMEPMLVVYYYTFPKLSPK